MLEVMWTGVMVGLVSCGSRASLWLVAFRLPLYHDVTVVPEIPGCPNFARNHSTFLS